MQKWDIRPLTTPKPLNRSSPKVAYVITSRISTDVHNLVTISQAVSFLRMREILLFLVPRSAWTVYGLVTNCLHLVLPSVTDAASLRYLPHHFNMSSIYLRAGRLGRRSPSTIPNNNAFNSRSSGIVQICQLLELPHLDCIHHCFFSLYNCSYLFISSSILPFHCRNTSVTPHLKCK